MGLELYMVGVIVADMERAVEFYRRLGLGIPEGSENQEHVEVKMGELTFFLSTRRANAKWDPDPRPASGGYRIILEFYLESREALDAKYEEMIGFGYEVTALRTTSHPRFASRWWTIPTGTRSSLSSANGE